MKIVRLSKDSNLTRIEKTFNWFRFSGRGPAGSGATTQDIGDLIASAEAKTELVDADGIGVSNSEDGDILVEWTYASLKAQLTTFFTGVFSAIFALLSSIQAHGIITISETFSSATKSEHTATAASAVDVTLELTTARPSMLIAVNVTTICTFSLVGSTPYEISTITNTGIDVAGLTQGDYFTLDTVSNGLFHFWFDIDAAGTGAPAIGGTNVIVSVATAGTAQDVADAVVASVDGNANFSAYNDSSTVTTVHNVEDGAVTGAADGAAATGFTFATLGITYTFPTGQTANLTDLAVGLWHIVPNTTDNGANVVVRVQQVS